MHKSPFTRRTKRLIKAINMTVIETRNNDNSKTNDSTIEPSDPLLGDLATADHVAALDGEPNNRYSGIERRSGSEQEEERKEGEIL